LEKQDFIDALHEVLAERAEIDTDLHASHHLFIAKWIAKEKREEERWEKIKTHVLGWGIIGIIGSIGTAVYHYFFKSGP